METIMADEAKVYIPRGMHFDRPVASIEEAHEREEQLQTELKRMQGKAAEVSKELSNERKRSAAREQQILDLGRLLKKHKIDWRAEVVWTDHTAQPP
jgi:hypothetical protein